MTQIPMTNKRPLEIDQAVHDAGVSPFLHRTWSKASWYDDWMMPPLTSTSSSGRKPPQPATNTIKATSNSRIPEYTDEEPSQESRDIGNEQEETQNRTSRIVLSPNHGYLSLSDEESQPSKENVPISSSSTTTLWNEDSQPSLTMETQPYEQPTSCDGPKPSTTYVIRSDCGRRVRIVILCACGALLAPERRDGFVPITHAHTGKIARLNGSMDTTESQQSSSMSFVELDPSLICSCGKHYAIPTEDLAKWKSKADISPSTLNVSSSAATAAPTTGTPTAKASTTTSAMLYGDD